MINKPVLAIEQACTGCMACMDACPKHAISKVVREDGHIYTKIDFQSCIGCLACQRVCSKIHSRTYSNNTKLSAPYSVYSKNAEFYNKATSGGIFPEIAVWILKQAGRVYGASYIDGVHVAHIGISDISELSKLQGSKYIQSDMSGVYLSVKRDLDAGKKVLFSGTGCQVAAILAFFDKNPQKDNLYTIDLVCGGVPSSLLIDTFVKRQKPQVRSIVHFREKEKYAFAYTAQDGSCVKLVKSLPLDGFKSSLTNRYSCYSCEFAGIHRKSDWTIGDLWGDTEKNVIKSLCICHNERAKKIFEQMDVEKAPLDNWEFAQRNPRLVDGTCPFSKRFERKLLGWLFRHCSYRTLCKIFASDVKKYDFVWMLYKIYRLFRFNKYFNKQRRVVERILK